MSRMEIMPDKNLDELIADYQYGKSREDEFKKSNGELNSKIKEIFLSNNMSEYINDNYKATVTTTEKTDFNEQKAIELIKKSDLTEEEIKSVIKTKEYIDDDALENLIYNKKFNPQILSECVTKLKPVYTLRITKNKILKEDK